MKAMLLILIGSLGVFLAGCSSCCSTYVPCQDSCTTSCDSCSSCNPCDI